MALLVAYPDNPSNEIIAIICVFSLVTALMIAIWLFPLSNVFG